MEGYVLWSHSDVPMDENLVHGVHVSKKIIRISVSAMLGREINETTLIGGYVECNVVCPPTFQ